MSSKKRLDVVMVERGLAESRQKAQAVIMAGQVFVDEQRVDKAGAPVTEAQKVEVRGKTLPYVSRGGLKLEKAMQLWPIELHGAVCADIGASTGGFTDCMLQNGAQKVYAVDVGYNQLDYRLRTHPRWCVWSGPMPAISPRSRSRTLWTSFRWTSPSFPSISSCLH